MKTIIKATPFAKSLCNLNYQGVFIMSNNNIIKESDGKVNNSKELDPISNNYINNCANNIQDNYLKNQNLSNNTSNQCDANN